MNLENYFRAHRKNECTQKNISKLTEKMKDLRKQFNTSKDLEKVHNIISSGIHCISVNKDNSDKILKKKREKKHLWRDCSHGTSVLDLGESETEGLFFLA